MLAFTNIFSWCIIFVPCFPVIWGPLPITISVARLQERRNDKRNHIQDQSGRDLGFKSDPKTVHNVDWHNHQDTTNSVSQRLEYKNWRDVHSSLGLTKVVNRSRIWFAPQIYKTNEQPTITKYVSFAFANIALPFRYSVITILDHM
jgi:hypothetical protein